jgi:hypothetical protein
LARHGAFSSGDFRLRARQSAAIVTGQMHFDHLGREGTQRKPGWAIADESIGIRYNQ